MDLISRRFLYATALTLAAACTAPAPAPRADTLAAPALTGAWRASLQFSSGAFASNHVVRRLDRALDLTPDQEQKVRAIVERRRARVETLWRESQPRIDEEMESAHREIEALLNPEQRLKFAKVVERWRHFAGPGPSGQAGERPDTGRPER